MTCVWPWCWPVMSDTASAPRYGQAPSCAAGVVVAAGGPTVMFAPAFVLVTVAGD